VPIFGSGKNIIPTIHVADLAAYVAAVCIEPPAQQYLLAADNAQLTQRDIVAAVAQKMGDTPVKEQSLAELYFQQVMPMFIGQCASLHTMPSCLSCLQNLLQWAHDKRCRFQMFLHLSYIGCIMLLSVIEQQPYITCKLASFAAQLTSTKWHMHAVLAGSANTESPLHLCQDTIGLVTFALLMTGH